LLVRGAPLDDHPRGRGGPPAGRARLHVEDGIRLHTLADVVPHLGASRQLGLLDVTEVRVRRPAAGRAGRRRFVSGKARATTAQGLVSPTLTGGCCAAHRPVQVPSTI
jgi:hypothetical protein